MEVKSGKISLEGVKALFSEERRGRVLMAVGILGMLLVLFSQCSFSDRADTSTQTDSASISAEEYTKALEKRLGNLIESMEGVGRAQVMVTLESSAQMVFATEEKVQTDRMQDVTGEEKRREQVSGNSQSSLVLVDGGNGKRPLVKTQLEPTVRGVVVVCAGAESKVVSARIIDVVTTALGIGANKVCVVKAGAS